MRTCPKCGRAYSAPPAISRIDETGICPVCGATESIAFLPEDEQKKLVAQIEEAEIEAGRVDRK